MEEYVLRFDVSMDDVVVVHELHSVADLFQVPFDSVLGKPDLFFQAAEQVASTAVLHHEVDVVKVVEKAVKVDDVGVV